MARFRVWLRYGMHVVHSGLMPANLITLANVRRQLKFENRAFVDSPRHPNTTVMAFDNRMADGKANSHTTLFGREHRVENMIVIGWIDARASILPDPRRPREQNSVC